MPVAAEHGPCPLLFIQGVPQASEVLEWQLGEGTVVVATVPGSSRKGMGQTLTKPVLCSKTSPDFAAHGLNFSVPGH